MIQNGSGFSDDDSEDGTGVDACENESTGSSSEDGDYGIDDNDNVRISEEDAYHRLLEYALYMKSLAHDLQAKCDAPTMKVNLTQFVGRSLLLFSPRASSSRPGAGKMQGEVNQHFKCIWL
ncbi:unnamed protein product [Porites lobata]|uniref:Uncharacterized protein n=1 Tax=Porites lobata TaxID=104759 RepID=A0ABN8NTN5_9CNID|nr:unnamed protein product [Porites lobata]